MAGFNPTVPSNTIDPFPAATPLFPEYVEAAHARLVEYLKPISTLLGLLYLGHVAVLTWDDGYVGTQLYHSAFGLSLYFFLLRLILGRARIGSRWTHPVAGFSAGLVIIHALLQISVAGEPWATTHLMLIILGIGTLFLSRPWFTIMTALAVGGWLYLAWPHRAGPEWFHLGISLLLTTCLAAFLHERRLFSALELERRVLDEGYRIDLLNNITTEAKKAHDRYCILCEAALDPMILHDAGKIIESNPASEDIFGYSGAELRTMNIWSLFSPETRQTRKEEFALGSFKNLEAEGRRKDGTPFAAEVHSRRIGGQSSPQCLLVVKDVTEVKRMYDTMVETARRCESTLRHQSALLVLSTIRISSQNLEIVLRSIVDFAQRELPSLGGAFLILWDGSRRRFVIGAAQSLWTMELGPLSSGGEADHLITHLNQQKETAVETDLALDRFNLRSLFPREVPRSAVIIPLINDEGMFGFLLTVEPSPREYRREEIEFLQILAQRAVEACTQVNLQERLQDATSFLTRVAATKPVVMDEPPPEPPSPPPPPPPPLPPSPPNKRRTQRIF